MSQVTRRMRRAVWSVPIHLSRQSQSQGDYGASFAEPGKPSTLPWGIIPGTRHQDDLSRSTNHGIIPLQGSFPFSSVHRHDKRGGQSYSHLSPRQTDKLLPPSYFERLSGHDDGCQLPEVVLTPSSPALTKRLLFRGLVKEDSSRGSGKKDGL